jgi:glycine betaine/choline ABC-type transport system substrate-binding protein
VIFITSQKIVDEAGPDFAKVIGQVQQNLTLPVIRELNSRVDIDKEEPAKVAHDYLKSSGLVQ